MLLRIRERYLTARQANGASPRDEERTREVLTLLDAIWSGNRALWAGDLAAPAIQGTTEDEPAPPARDPGDATAVAAPVAAYKRLMGALPAQWGRGPLSRLLTTVDHPLAAALLSRLWRPAAQATPRLLISERRAEGRPGPASPLAVGAAATVIDGRLSPAAIDLALDWSLPEGPPASFTPVTLRLTITRADDAAWATDEESAAGAGDAPEPDALASREFFGVLPELPGGSRVCWTVGRIDLATLLGERLATLAGESALLEITASLDRRDPAGPAARRAPAFTPADDEDDDALLRDVAAATRPAPPPAAPPATIPGRAPTRYATKPIPQAKTDSTAPPDPADVGNGVAPATGLVTGDQEAGRGQAPPATARAGRTRALFAFGPADRAKLARRVARPVSVRRPGFLPPRRPTAAGGAEAGRLF